MAYEIDGATAARRDLSGSEKLALAIVRHLPRVTATDLCNLAGVTHPTAMRILRKLEATGDLVLDREPATERTTARAR